MEVIFDMAQLGKRYRCAPCATEVLRTKAVEEKPVSSLVQHESWLQ